MDGEYGVKIYTQECLYYWKKGVEKVIELKLSSDEKNQFDKSINAVKDLFDAAKKIDNSLKD